MYEKTIHSKEVVLNALRFVRKKIMNHQNYFNIAYKEIRDFINFYKKDSGKNREHFANALIISVTSMLDGKFKIIKSGNCFENQGACWLLDCEESQNLMHNKKEIDSICGKKCKFRCKNGSTLVKLLDLNAKSLTNIATYDLTKI